MAWDCAAPRSNVEELWSGRNSYLHPFANPPTLRPRGSAAPTRRPAPAGGSGPRPDPVAAAAGSGNFDLSA